MKSLFLNFILIFVIGSISAQQVVIERIAQMPNNPQPYLMRNWKVVAQDYDSLVFNVDLNGEYLPLVATNDNGINYPNHQSAAMVTYVGKTLGTSAEGINYLPAVIGATLAGIDKSNQFDQNWVLMSENFFNLASDENIYLNNYSASSGHDWWYETMPNIFFYQLNDLYPNTGDFNEQFVIVADRWLEALKSMGGSASPWEFPYMNYRAWNLKQMIPLTEGVKQPEAAGAIAWILYNAYLETENEDYLIGAEWALEFLNNWDDNPSYELQLPYGTYVSARMNAEIGTNYDIEKMLNWSFERGDLRGWGTIVGTWGDYDCSGLIGEANDNGNDYAFLMNGFQHAAALLPLVRYDERFADAIGKWMLNLANASRLFYPGFLLSDHQDSEEWAIENDPNHCVAHEAMKEVFDGKSPFSTGDAIRNGWAPTNLALYGASHVGYFGSLIDTTNIEAILKLDLTKTDFYSTAYPTFLLWNPYATDTIISLNVGEEQKDIYNVIENEFILNELSGHVEILIPAHKSIILVYVPDDAEIVLDGNKTLANSIVIDFDNGEFISDHPPRIKALKALKNPVEITDSIKVYCTAQDVDHTEITYHWTMDGNSIIGNEILSIKAPEEAGFYHIVCTVSSGSGLSASKSLYVEVKDRIPSIPKIISIEGSPGKIDIGQYTQINCQVEEGNGDELSFEWSTSEGSIIGDGEDIKWTAPSTFGDYTIYCQVSDVDGSANDSIIVMVRDLSNLEKGDPILYLPFSGNANDYSLFNQQTTPYNITFQPDVNHTTTSSGAFNGATSYISVDNNDQLNFRTGLTLTGWIFSQDGGGDEAYPISHGNWDNRWKVSISNNILRFTVRTNQGIRDLDAKTLIKNEQWQHFAMVYSGTDLEIYLDGELDSFVPFTGDIASTSYDLVLGRARPDQDFYFEGRLDEIYLFDHPLSPTHIKEVYHNTTSIIEQSKQGRIHVFPNPANECLWIDYSPLTETTIDFQLIDLTGKIIKSGAGLYNHQSPLYINTSKMQTGIYLLNMQMGDLFMNTKVIITR